MNQAEEKHSRPSGLIRVQMYLSIFVASLLMIIRGSVIVWTSPIEEKLDNLSDNPLGRVITDDESSWLASVVTIGGIIGSLTFGAIAQKLGRKILLTIVCIPSLLFYVMMTFSKTIWLYYIARTLGGIGIGGIITLLPMYICELADPKIRGKLCVSMGIFKNIGSLLTYCVGPYVPFYWFHFGYSFLPLSFGIFIYFFALESPYYYMKTDPVKAERLLKEIRGKEDVSEEMNEMRSRMTKTSNATFLDVFKSKNTRIALLIGLGITGFSQLSGHNVVMNYTADIFNDIGGNLSADIQNIILGWVELVTKFFASGLTDKFRRRSQFFVSYIGAAFCHFSLGLYVVLQDQGTDMTNFKWIPLVSLTCYFVVYDLGIGMLSQTVLGEIFPARVKSIGISLCDVNGDAFGFLTTLLFKRVKKAIGLGQTFWIFGGAAICAVIFIYFFLIETRGKTLEEVQGELDDDEGNELAP